MAKKSSTAAPPPVNPCEVYVALFFRLSSMFYHFAVAFCLAYALYFEAAYVKYPREAAAVYNSFGGPYKYLSHVNLVMSIIYYFIAGQIDFANAISEKQCESQKAGEMRDFFYAFLAGVTFFLVSTFWVLYAFDRRLIFPRKLDSVVPMWLKLLMYFMPLLFIVIDMGLGRHNYPSRPQGINFISIFGVLFLIWTLLTTCINNTWTLAILNVMALHERILFFVACGVLLLGSYIFMEQLFVAIHGDLMTTQSSMGVASQASLTGKGSKGSKK